MAASGMCWCVSLGADTEVGASRDDFVSALSVLSVFDVGSIAERTSSPSSFSTASVPPGWVSKIVEEHGCIPTVARQFAAIGRVCVVSLYVSTYLESPQAAA